MNRSIGLGRFFDWLNEQYHFTDFIDFWAIFQVLIILIVFSLLLKALHYLRSGSKAKVSIINKSRNNDLILVLDTINLIQFEEIKALLNAEGIPFTAKNNSSSMFNGLGNYEIYVAREFEIRANELINTFKN